MKQQQNQPQTPQDGNDSRRNLATLTAPNGAAAVLARLTSEAARVNVWGDILETLADG